LINNSTSISIAANSFGECKDCDSKWFKAPFQTSNDGKLWNSNIDKTQLIMQLNYHKISVWIMILKITEFKIIEFKIIELKN
jgi:hypothetical protein